MARDDCFYDEDGFMVGLQPHPKALEQALGLEVFLSQGYCSNKSRDKCKKPPLMRTKFPRGTFLFFCGMEIDL